MWITKTCRVIFASSAASRLPKVPVTWDYVGLGRGLQSPVRRFESARRLQKAMAGRLHQRQGDALAASQIKKASSSAQRSNFPGCCLSMCPISPR